MDTTPATACNTYDLISSHYLWLLMLVAGVVIWSRRERYFYRLLIERTNEAEELAKSYDLKIRNLQQSHQQELDLLMKSKNLVWLRVTDKGEIFQCPGCGYRHRSDENHGLS